MLIVSLCQTLFGATALVFCALTASAVLRGDRRAHLWLTLSGSFALVVFVSIAEVRYEMIGVALITIAAGILMTPAEERTPLSLDSTATRRRR